MTINQHWRKKKASKFSSFRLNKKHYKNTASSSKTLIGLVKRHPDGFGFFIPEDPLQPTAYLPRAEMKGLMSEDIIKVRLSRRLKDKTLFAGKTLQLIERGQNYVIGEYFPLNNTAGLLKDEHCQWGEDLKIQLTKDQKIKKGEWVQAKIISFPASRKGFQGVLVSSLGVFPKGTKDNIRMIQKYNIPSVFSPEVLAEADECPVKIPANELKERKDLRALPFVTIDGQTAQDFDDAVCAVTRKQGGWILYTAIADVSYYVGAGTAMDKEAELRGNSTYLPGFTLPMLPEKLSNDLCSLKPHQDRLAFVVEMHFNAKAEKLKTIFYTAVIRSQARLNYGQAQDIIDKFEQKDPPVVDTVSWSVVQAKALAKTLLKQRIKKHFINLDIPETEVLLNKHGEPVDIIKSPRLFSHQLIEELMLAANQSTAHYIYKKSLPSVYRVHDPPKTEALALLESFVQSLGYREKLSKKAGLHKKISDLIYRFADHPASAVLHNMILRSLSQAVYKNEKKEHFGLNTQYYTHFTSPIRRYSDLVVHRILKSSLTKTAQPVYNKKQLALIAAKASAGEQRSVKAERQVKDIKKARFIKKHLGRQMDGIISSVLKFGCFVKLRLYDIEGLVRVERLKGYWFFDPKRLQLRAKKTGKSLQIGDFVKIQIISSNIDTGQIDFDLIKHQKK